MNNATKEDGDAEPGLVCQADQVQVSADGSTVWVHALDGSTVGRYSKRFGLDVHTTVSQQMDGAAQCLHCTHEAATHADWLVFCRLMAEHHEIRVDADLIHFEN